MSSMREAVAAAKIKKDAAVAAEHAPPEEPAPAPNGGGDAVGALLANPSGALDIIAPLLDMAKEMVLPLVAQGVPMAKDAATNFVGTIQGGGAKDAVGQVVAMVQSKEIQGMIEQITNGDLFGKAVAMVKGGGSEELLGKIAATVQGAGVGDLAGKATGLIQGGGAQELLGKAMAIAQSGALQQVAGKAAGVLQGGVPQALFGKALAGVQSAGLTDMALKAFEQVKGGAGQELLGKAMSNELVGKAMSAGQGLAAGLQR